MIVIAAVPYVESADIIMAPAYIKAIAAKHGFSSYAIDLNVEVLTLIKSKPNRDRILNFFLTQEIHEDTVNDIRNIINYCANRIAERNPEIIALSLLTFLSQIATRWICAKLRQLCPNARIVIGGPGIKNQISDSNLGFINQLIELKLIDDVIHGDAELSFPEYLRGNYDYPGINNYDWNRVELNSIPTPDYSDYDLSLYERCNIPIIDSRGCVKNCEFCDIIEFWSKYQYRTADVIFAEMLEQIRKYNIRSFEFRSSLVNGNMKEFKKLLKLICDYNEANSEQISWGGYFIIRAANSHTPELMEQIGKSNGCLWVGVESVIPEIRSNMGKPYTNEDLDYHLESSKKYGFKLILLLISGYPHETLEHYETTKQWFKDRTQYIDNILLVSITIASILPGTALERRSKDYNIIQGPYPSVWINQNLKITTKQRLNYFQELQQLVKDLGYNLYDDQKASTFVMDVNGY